MSYKIIEIDDENVEEYSEFLDPDMQEQLDRAFFRGIGAVDDTDQPVGAMVYELENLENSEDTKSRIRLLNAQNDDIKNEILNAYAEAVKEDEVTESFYESADQDMSNYLNSKGFSFGVSEAHDIIVTLDDIKKVAGLLKGRNTPPYIKSLSDISVVQFRKFVKECLFKGRRGLMDDLAYIPKSWFDQDVSACVVTDDQVNGALLVKKSPSGMFFAMLFTAFGADFQKNLALMMTYSAKKIVELYPDGVNVVIRRHNDMVKKLTDKFFAANKGNDVYSGNRKEIA